VGSKLAIHSECSMLTLKQVMSGAISPSFSAPLMTSSWGRRHTMAIRTRSASSPRIAAGRGCVAHHYHQDNVCPGSLKEGGCDAA